MTILPTSYIRIVLVRPRNPNNIGAAARAMANFGLKDLVVVDPYEPVWNETQAAVGAEEVLSRARKLSLEDALLDCHLILGTTTARRRSLKQPLVLLPDLPKLLQEKMTPHDGHVAIMFGQEKTGLRNQELERCHAWVKISTQPAVPSMNLGQAVAVVAYELTRLMSI